MRAMMAGKMTKQMMAEAADNARSLARLAGRVARGEATALEAAVEWVTGHLRQRAYCDALVAARDAALADKLNGDEA